MKPLHWVVILSAFGGIGLAVALFGWPRTFEQAGGFASFVAAILTPASLLLVVASLEKQERQQRQATQDGFLSVQVDALIALINDDRSKLDGMTADFHRTNEPNKKFRPVQRRYQQRVAKLNEILGADLRLPELTDVGVHKREPS